jgi:hypothetical protein
VILGPLDRSRRRLLQLLTLASALSPLAIARAADARGVKAGADAASASSDAAFEQRFGDAFLDRYWRFNTDAAVSVGYYQVAAQLVVPDARYRADYLRFLEAAIVQLQGFALAPLDAAHRTDWAVLDNQMRYERWALQELREWQWNPALYNVAEPLAIIVSTDYAPLPERLRGALERLRDVPAYYLAARAAIAHPTHEHTTLAIEQNRGALSTFDDLGEHAHAAELSAGERTEFTRRIELARRAVGDYVGWLEALDARRGVEGARSFRLGRALYERKFQFVHQSGDTAQSLYRRAQAERQAVLASMEHLADQLWPRYLAGVAAPADRFEKIGRLIETLSSHHATPESYVPSIERLIPEMASWVGAHHLVELDPSKPLQVRLTPPYERGVAIAGIEAPGPYDAGARTYFNVDPLDPSHPTQTESFLREYNDWTLPVFIMHEAIPGHYVQLMHANRSPSRIKAIFGNGAMIEGWAVYGERLMLESGYGAGAPEQWLFYWKWYLRSVTNTLLDYGVHVLGMSEADAHHLLTHEAFQSQQEAARKWVRVERSSVQLTSYFAGFSAIYRLRERLRAGRGAQFDLHAFHEQFLSYGSAPIALIATLMSA